MQSYIPPNVDDTGGFFNGLIPKRNAFDAGIALLIIYIAFRFAFVFLSVIARAAVGGGLAIVIGAVCVMGIDGRSVSEVLMDMIHFKKTKAVITLAMPRVDESALEEDVE